MDGYGGELLYNQTDHKYFGLSLLRVHQLSLLCTDRLLEQLKAVVRGGVGAGRASLALAIRNCFGEAEVS